MNDAPPTITLIGGPYDGERWPVPFFSGQGQVLYLPSPAHVANAPRTSQPTIYSGPTDRYVVEVRDGSFVGVHR
jgi:hypothetical protein